MMNPPTTNTSNTLNTKPILHTLPPVDASVEDSKEWVKTWIIDRNWNDGHRLNYAFSRFNWSGSDFYRLPRDTMSAQLDGFGFSMNVYISLPRDIMTARMCVMGAEICKAKRVIKADAEAIIHVLPPYDASVEAFKEWVWTWIIERDLNDGHNQIYRVGPALRAFKWSGSEFYQLPEDDMKEQLRDLGFRPAVFGQMPCDIMKARAWVGQAEMDRIEAAERVKAPSHPLPPYDASVEEFKEWVKMWMDRHLDDGKINYFGRALSRFTWSGSEFYELPGTEMRYGLIKMGFHHHSFYRLITLDIEKARAWAKKAERDRKADIERRKLVTSRGSTIGGCMVAWAASSLSKNGEARPKLKVD